MRIAILADIHGNYHGLDAALRDVEAVGVDRIIVLGDLADRGPDPAACVERVRETADVCLKGNTDAYVIQMADGESPPYIMTLQQYAPTRWATSQLSEEHFAYLRSLPDQHVVEEPGMPAIRFVHGSPRSANEGITSRGEFGMTPDVALALIAEAVLVFGHTHRSEDWRIDGRWAVNAGSVGQPFDRHDGAQYVVLTGEDGAWTLERREAEYDTSALEAAYRDSGYLEVAGAFGWASMMDALVGGDYLMRYVRHMGRLAREAGVDPRRIPDEVYRQADDAFERVERQAGGYL